MVNFRRVVTVLAVLALFTGMAFAQSESCSAQGTVSTPLRAEGFTEQTGDIIITCTGGQAIQPGNNIPLVNITVFYTTTVTSRLLSTNANNAGQFPSEALLLIDEPNTNPLGLPVSINAPAGNTVTWGQTQTLNPCNTPFQGCTQLAGVNQSGFTAAAAPAYNVYQGLVSGNSVTFYGVPALPPATVGSRVYRITNVRVNATQGGLATGTQPINGFISVSGAGSFPISNAQPVVGYIQPGLTAAVAGAGNFKQCRDQALISTTTSLKFTELFGTAFKTRVVAQQDTPGAGQNGVVPNAPAALNQSTPGAIYNSESNFIYTNGPFGSAPAGLADFGTRLKATFNNVPSGVSVYVTSKNKVTAPAVPGGSVANANTTGYAVIISGGETSGDGSGFTPKAYVDTDTTAVTIVSGTGTAVWEVVNANPNTTETFEFGVFVSFKAATATDTPKTGSATVTLTYAPTPPAFSATDGAKASSSLSIPRFSIGSTPFSGTVFTITKCRTLLLYPFVTNVGGFETGLAVANTSQDPVYATGEQHGKCVFNFYGAGTNPAPYDTTVEAAYAAGIPGGQVWANTLTAAAGAGFQGYAFAVCDFQFAHGFAFISDAHATNLAMGYLALVIPDIGSRDPSPFGNGSLSGEQEAH